MAPRSITRRPNRTFILMLETIDPNNCGDLPAREQGTVPKHNTSDIAGFSSAAMDAWHDWWAGTRNVALWLTLAWYDIVLKYRRSMLGPLWLTISMGLMLIGMGPLYSTLFNVPSNKFFPHLTLGIIFWTFFTSTINDGCAVFLAAAPFLKAATFHLSAFVWRSLARNLIQLAHYIVLFVPVELWAGISPTPRLEP